MTALSEGASRGPRAMHVGRRVLQMRSPVIRATGSSATAGRPWPSRPGASMLRVLVLLVVAPGAAAQTAADTLAIRTAALNYITT